MRVCCAVMLAGALTAGLAGCQNQAGSPEASAAAGGVAVIDLDQVATQLGRDVQMVNSIRQQQSKLNDQLQQYQVSLKKQLDEKKTELERAQSVSAEDQQQRQADLNSLDRALGLKLNQVRQQAQRTLSGHRQQLVAKFRNEVKPIAQAVAAEHGLSVVVTKNDNVVFAYAHAVDITDRVIEKMQSAGPTSAAANTASRTVPAPVQR